MISFFFFNCIAKWIKPGLDTIRNYEMEIQEKHIERAQPYKGL